MPIGTAIAIMLNLRGIAPEVSPFFQHECKDCTRNSMCYIGMSIMQECMNNLADKYNIPRAVITVER